MTRVSPPTVGQATGALLVILLLLTGAVRSPLLPLLVPWGTLVATTLPRRTAGLLALSASAILLLGEQILDGVGVSDLGMLLTTAVAAGLLVVWVDRRGARQAARLAELDAIRSESERSERRQPDAEAAARLSELRRVLAAARDRTGATRVTLWEVEAGQRAAPRATSEGTHGPRPTTLHGDPLGWVWSEGMPVRMETAAWADGGGSVHAFRIERGADDDRALVTFEFAHGAGPAAPAALADVVRTIAAEVALHDRTAAHAADRRRTAVLLDTLRRIPTVTAPYDFASELLAGAVGLADGTGGAVATWRDDGGRVLAVAGEDGGAAVGREFRPLESEMALAARAAVELVRAPRDTRGLPVASPGELWIRPPRALAVFPLATSHGVVGALAVWTSLAHALDDGALDLLRTLAPHAALQLEQALEYGRLRDTAERDPLTGLRNRRAFDRALAREASRLDRYGHPVGLLVLDLDHFKAVNDRFGHDAGDAVLQALARRIEAGIRDIDVAARFGGEEFVVLLPETDLPAAADVAERLRQSVEAMDVRWAGEAVPVRVSIGASACPTVVADPGQLVRSADTALYQAKRAGRNRVENASPAT